MEWEKQSAGIRKHLWVSRMTRDIDIIIEIDRISTNKLFDIFKEDFYIDENVICEAIEHEGIFNIIHNVSLLKIDFIIRKETPYRKIEFQRRRQIQMDNISLWIVAPEDLIVSKLFWAKDSFSEMQIKDVKNLLFCLKDLIDFFF